MTLSKIIIGALGCLCLYTISLAEVVAIKQEINQLRKEIEAKRRKLDIPAIGLTLVDKDKITGYDFEQWNVAILTRRTVYMDLGSFMP